MWIVIHNFFDPSDWVEVHLEQIPSNVDAIYVIVLDREGKCFPLKWYLSEAGSLLADPKIVGEQWYWTVRGSERRGDIQWVAAASVGVLARLKSGKWVLWWLKPEWIHGPSPSRYLLGGGGNVTIQTLGIESSEDSPKSLLEQVKP